MVEQEATQERVAHGHVALPSGREPLSDGHATTLTTAIAARSHADRSASQIRRSARRAGRSVAPCAFVCSGPSSWSTPMVTPAPSAAPISARCSRSCSRPAGEVVTIDALVDALWGDSAPASAVSTLRTYVSRLRRHLGTALASRGGGFALDVAAGAARRRTLRDPRGCRRSRRTPTDSADMLAAALDLWKGAAFGDRADVERVRAEARRLEERRRAAREAHAAALLHAGRVDEAVAAAEALVTAEPLREGGWAVLIEALAGAQRPADALRAFQRAAAVLAEVGLEPSTRLREAERGALSGDATRRRPPDGDRRRSAAPAPVSSADRPVLVRRTGRRHRPRGRTARARPSRHAHWPGRRRQDPSRPRGRSPSRTIDSSSAHASSSSPRSRIPPPFPTCSWPRSA